MDWFSDRSAATQELQFRSPLSLAAAAGDDAFDHRLPIFPQRVREVVVPRRRILNTGNVQSHRLALFVMPSAEQPKTRDIPTRIRGSRVDDPVVPAMQLRRTEDSIKVWARLQAKTP